MTEGESNIIDAPLGLAGRVACAADLWNFLNANEWIDSVNVCFMIDSLSPAGTELQLLAVIKTLDRSLCRPHLCLLHGEDALSRSMEPEDCPVLRLGITKLGSLGLPRKAWRFGKFLRDNHIDLFQAHFPDSIYFGVPLAKLSGVKRIIMTRRDSGYWVTDRHRRLGRLVSRFADATLANSEEARQNVISDYRLNLDTVHVIENGVDLSRFESLPAPESSPRGTRPRTVGLLANLRPVKDPEFFLRVAARLAASHEDVHFEIAGDGELLPGLIQLAQNLGIDRRVHFLGSVADVPSFLAHLDVAVLCSRSEGLSNAVLEYMAAARPIVATAVGGSTRLIEDGVEGFLVPCGCAERMFEAIDRLLRDAHLARALGEAAREKVRRQFSLEAKTRELESFYRSILSSQGAIEWP